MRNTYIVLQHIFSLYAVVTIMDRMKRMLLKNPRTKKAYVCKNCSSLVFFTSLADIESHMRLVHGRESSGTLVVLECKQYDRATFLGTLTHAE